MAVNWKQKWRDVRPYVLSGLIYRIVWLITSTLRIEIVNFQERSAGRILAYWHGRTIIGLPAFKNRGITSIVSQSKDGDLQHSIVTRFGFNTIRGSTGRGGIQAAIEAIKLLREGRELAITPDGPRGPSGVVQEGILLMLRKSGASVVPVGISADRRWLAKSWDKYLIPKPFAKCIILMGEEMRLPPQATPEQEEEFRLQLEREIHRLEQEAETRMGHGVTQS